MPDDNMFIDFTQGQIYSDGACASLCCVHAAGLLNTYMCPMMCHLMFIELCITDMKFSIQAGGTSALNKNGYVMCGYESRADMQTWCMGISPVQTLCCAEQ